VGGLPHTLLEVHGAAASLVGRPGTRRTVGRGLAALGRAHAAPVGMPRFCSLPLLLFRVPPWPQPAEV